MKQDDQDKGDGPAASIRPIAQREGSAAPAGTRALALTPEMRVAPGRAAPRPAAGDEDEPPLVLRARLDAEAAEPAAEAPDAPSRAPAEDPLAAPGVAAAARRGQGEPEETPPPSPPEEPPERPDETPQPLPEEPPASPPEEPPAPSEVPPQAPPETGAGGQVFAAPLGGRGDTRQGGDPRTARRSFGATPNPVSATGLPRNRAELEEVVREAIRKELGGEMGERVSRNIRALIAREVERALDERRGGEDGPDGAA